MQKRRAQFLDCVQFLRSSTRLPFEHLNSDTSTHQLLSTHKRIKSHRIKSHYVYDI